MVRPLFPPKALHSRGLPPRNSGYSGWLSKPLCVPGWLLDVSGLGHLINPRENISKQIRGALRAAVALTAVVGVAQPASGQGRLGLQ